MITILYIITACISGIGHGVLGVANGGTGESTFGANRILIGNDTSAFNQVAIGNSGEFLISNGSGSAPSFTDTIDGGEYS